MGLLAVVRYLSMAVSFPLASTLADRHSRKWVMLASRSRLRCVRAHRCRRDRRWTAHLSPSTPSRSRRSSPRRAFALHRRPCFPACAGSRRADRGQRGRQHDRERRLLRSARRWQAAARLYRHPDRVYVVNAVTFLWSAAFVVGIRAPAVSAAEERRHERGASSGTRAPASARFSATGPSTVIGLFCAQTVVAGASLSSSSRSRLTCSTSVESGVGYLDAAHGDRRPRRGLRRSRARAAGTARARLRIRRAALVGAAARSLPPGRPSAWPRSRWCWSASATPLSTSTPTRSSSEWCPTRSWVACSERWRARSSAPWPEARC